MNASRILVLSNARPSRVWKLASRIAREVTGAGICGIVQQHPTDRRGNSAITSSLDRKFWHQRWLEEVAHWVLWVSHGCPCGLNKRDEFRAEELTKRCDEIKWPLFLRRSISDVGSLQFIRRQAADLILVIGDMPVDPELLAMATHGVIRASYQPMDGDDIDVTSVQIRIEHFAPGSQTPFLIASLTLPLQPYDTPSTCMLKADLIVDDLLVHTTASLQTASQQQASKAVSEWIQETLSSYLLALEDVASQRTQTKATRQRLRRPWKVCIETLLFAPRVIARNWYRRWRARYPVLILGHHLVSDRPHRMGISTEDFWCTVRFLKRHYRVVSLSEGVELLRAGRVTAPTVVLTFDDGYVDNFVNLRAVADEAGIPVTLFIATQPVELQREFQHDLAHGITGVLPLTWEQIRYWSVRGAEFGSHTRTHCDCGSTDPERLEWELVGSKSDLEFHLGMPVCCFAFPFGKQKNIPAVAAHMAASAYSHFVSCFGGENLVADASNDQAHLLRKNLYPNLWELELELQSVFDWVETMKRSFGRKSVEPANSQGRASTVAALESEL